MGSWMGWNPVGAGEAAMRRQGVGVKRETKALNEQRPARGSGALGARLGRAGRQEMLILRGRASSTFGTVRVRMPLLKAASTLLESTRLGRLKARVKEP